jgi:hypothetical protein
MRRYARSSTYYMGLVLGFADLTPFHGEMAAWMQGPGRRKLGLVPRDHLKTSLWTIADSMRLLSVNPLERILLLNETNENAGAFLRRIKHAAEHNTLWQWLFPERVPDFQRNWSDDALTFPRPQDFVEPTVAAIGVGGASTSRHYTRIKEDDLIGKEASESRLVMNKAIDQHKLAEHLLVDPERNTIDTYGTRWGNADLYDWMLKNEDPATLSVFHRGCYDPDGTPWWSERFSAAELDRLKRKNGARLFSFQMLNQPVAEGATDFREEWLCYYTLDTTKEGEPIVKLEQPDATIKEIPLAHLAKFQAVDPGLKADPNTTRRDQEARSAIVTVGITPTPDNEPFDIVILGARAKAVSPGAFTRLVYDEYALWTPGVVGIEVFAAQKIYFEWLRRDFPEMPLTTFKTDTHVSKLSRIRSVSPYFEQRRVYVHRSMTDFREEYVSFPSGHTVDLLDAFAYTPGLWFSLDPDEFENHEDEEIFDRYGSGRDAKTGY